MLLPARALAEGGSPTRSTRCLIAFGRQLALDRELVSFLLIWAERVLDVLLELVLIPFVFPQLGSNVARILPAALALFHGDVRSHASTLDRRSVAHLALLRECLLGRHDGRRSIIRLCLLRLRQNTSLFWLLVVPLDLVPLLL